MSFSAQTSAKKTLNNIVDKLSSGSRRQLAAPPGSSCKSPTYDLRNSPLPRFFSVTGKKFVVFVDDVNMPTVEQFGAMPPIELLRQFLDYRGTERNRTLPGL